MRKTLLTILSLSLIVVISLFATNVLFKKKPSPNFSVTTLAAVLPSVLLAHTNNDRVLNGVPLLVENPLLSRAAQMKAEDMLQRGYYSHTTPEGNTPLYWLDLVGYKYLNVGENLDLTYVQTEEDIQTAWMNSPTHKANLLLPVFTEVGVGVASGEYQGIQVTFAVELYATPLPPPVVVPKEKYIPQPPLPKPHSNEPVGENKAEQALDSVQSVIERVLPTPPSVPLATTSLSSPTPTFFATSTATSTETKVQSEKKSSFSDGNVNGSYANYFAAYNSLTGVFQSLTQKLVTTFLQSATSFVRIFVGE